MAEKIAMSVEEAVKASNLSRSTIYALIRSGALQSIKHGRRRLIPTAELESYMNRLRIEQNGRAA